MLYTRHSLRGQECLTPLQPSWQGWNFAADVCVCVCVFITHIVKMPFLFELTKSPIICKYQHLKEISKIDRFSYMQILYIKRKCLKNNSCTRIFYSYVLLIWGWDGKGKILPVGLHLCLHLYHSSLQFSPIYQY